MNAFDPSLFSVGAPCLPCCGSQVECVCANLIPGTFSSIYSDYAAAATAISDSTFDCLVFTPFGTAAGSASDTSTPNQIILTPGGTVGTALVVSITIPDNTTLTLTATGTGNDATLYLYDCFYNFVDGSFGSGVTTLFVATGNTYYAQIVNGATILTLSSDTSMIFNPVIALWDDSGTTRQLEACPKLLLPILTESTGDWYADCAAAAAVISAQVSNCVGYIDTTDFTTFVATDGGASLALQMVGYNDGINPPQNDLTAYGSVNAEAGETLTFSISATGAGPFTTYYVEIYDDTGTSIESLSGAAGPFVSSALPYTGRYIIRVRFNTLLAPLATIDATFTITSSGTLSVNPIQALYDVGLDCPARLSCGDSC